MGTGLKPLNHFRLKAVLRPGQLAGILTWNMALLASWQFFIAFVRLVGHARSDVTGTARPAFRLLYRELVPGWRAGRFGTDAAKL